MFKYVYYGPLDRQILYVVVSLYIIVKIVLSPFIKRHKKSLSHLYLIYAISPNLLSFRENRLSLNIPRSSGGDEDIFCCLTERLLKGRLAGSRLGP